MGAVVVLCSLVWTSVAGAFCGFYVGGSGDALYNEATHVVLMREGQRTVLAMANNYQGPPENFALVIPVPVVLQQPQVKTLPAETFDRLDQLTAPRLVEYWEQDPCPFRHDYDSDDKEGGTGTRAKGEEGSMGMPAAAPVKVEAKFSVNEYEIVILSASESTGLDAWLREHDYKIPDGAEAALRPYVEGGSKFFVAKVDASKVKLKDGKTMLSPLRFYYDSERFDLPVRLGLLNAKGAQDLIVHIVARNRRYDVANYPNVTIPTNIEVKDSVRAGFAGFYATLFDATLVKNPRAVVTEYAWSAASCDPCPTPPLSDRELSLLGADALPSTKPKWGPTSATDYELKVTTEPDWVKETSWQRQAASSVRTCFERNVRKDDAAVNRLELTLAFDSEGEVASTDAGDFGASATLVSCVVNRLRSRPLDDQRRPEEIIVSYDFSSDPNALGRVPPRGFDRDYVVTRLHARYGKETLGEDLVFRAAPAIVGGREFMVGDALEHGAKVVENQPNNFQARYIIRHLWEGPVTCADPEYGHWGGPPGRTRPALEPARDLAFAPRGQVKLETVAYTPVPELDIAGLGRPKRPVGSGILDLEEHAFEPKNLLWVALLLGLLLTVAAGLLGRRLAGGQS